MPPQKPEKPITLNLKEFVPPPLTVIPPPAVDEELPTEQSLFEDEEVYQQAYQQMTRNLFQKISDIETTEVNTTKIAEKEVEEPMPQEVITPAPKPKKKMVKKKPKKVAKKVVKKKKRKPKKVAKEKPKNKKIKKTVRKSKRSNDPLANILRNAGTSHKTSKRSAKPSIRMVRQFYGEEFNSFTPTQKKFIEKNLGAIHRITQATLSRKGYPSVAERTRQHGTAIVSFYLHPNGAISGLRLKKRIGYASLDNNTLKVIRIAYKDYPRPKTKTKITFYVEYRLF